MTQPVQEPTQGRQDSHQAFRSRQLFRRPSTSTAAFAKFEETSGITAVAGSHTTPWDITLNGGAGNSTIFAVDGSGDLITTELGIYVIVVNTSIDASVVTSATEDVSWADGYMTVLHQDYPGQNDVGFTSIWSITSGTPPFVLSLALSYVATGGGAFAMGLGGTIARL